MTVRSGLLSLEQLEDAAVRRRHAGNAGCPPLAGWRLLFETIRRTLSAQVYDVIEATGRRRRPYGRCPGGSAEQCGLVCFSEQMALQSASPAASAAPIPLNQMRPLRPPSRWCATCLRPTCTTSAGAYRAPLRLAERQSAASVPEPERVVADQTLWQYVTDRLSARSMERPWAKAMRFFLPDPSTGGEHLS
jgi:hypothetical protein